MADIERLIAAGEKFGLKGGELSQFVKEQQERDERKEKENYEREERNRDREIKRLEIEKEVELEKSKNTLARIESQKEIRFSAKLPKLPLFNERLDSIDAYLRRFERFADNAKWETSSWATNLGALLTGKALEVYSRLSTSDLSDYDKLKSALLLRFDLTEEGCRSRFRKCSKENGETAQQMIHRLADYLDNWLKQAGQNKTYEGLRDLVLREQFLNSSGKGLELFLRERKFSSVFEMAAGADRYLEAHGGWQDGGSLRARGNQGRPGEAFAAEANKGKSCFNCSGPHLRRDCPSLMQKNAAAVKTNGGYSNQGGYWRGQEYNQNKNGNKKLSACCLSEDKVILSCGHELPVMSAVCNQVSVENMPEYVGTVFGRQVSVLRDTGCSTVIVKKSLVDEGAYTGYSQKCVLMDGTVRKFPVAMIKVRTPILSGEIRALCVDSPVYDLIIGNVDRVNDSAGVKSDEAFTPEKSATVQTRAQAKKEAEKPKPMKVPGLEDFQDFSREELIKGQEGDETLNSAREQEKTGEIRTCGKMNQYRFFKKNGILFREFLSPKYGQGIKQIVLPSALRDRVMKIAHESLLGGHLGTQKTADKIMSQFHWPGIIANVKRYCASCDICQRTVAKGKVGKAPLERVPLIDVPFQKVAVDLIGPIAPVSERGHRYILTVVDYATRYPEAVPLKRIETETVAESLVEMFTRVGVPKEVLSDQGSQFTSGLMAEVSRLLSIKQVFTTPYHAQCNGLVEKFNGTLKAIIKRLCSEKPKDWDKYIAPALFAYREAPQASTGFSPFELLYGRTVRGPMYILKELLSKDQETNEVKNVYQYVLELRERLSETMAMAQRELGKSQERYKRNFDSRAKARNLEAGNKALILLPTNQNKLLMQWRGPYEVVEKVGPVDYKLKINGKEKIYHVNMIKQYHDRASNQQQTNTTRGLFQQVGSAVIELEDTKDLEDIEVNEYGNVTGLEIPTTERLETEEDVIVGQELTQAQKDQLKGILKSYPDVLTDVPGKTDLVEHKISLTTYEPIRTRQYPVPHALKDTIDEEVEQMLEMDIIEPSDSPYCSPVVVVRKPDGTNRFCVDYRKINQITRYDAEPTSDQEDIFARLNGCRYFTRMDLSKGYWQIPVAKDSRKYTSFMTRKGLWQFKRMPFGLATAPGNFCRMMRRLLNGLECVENYMDDILIATRSFEEHLTTIQKVLERLRKAGLTAKPSKCMMAQKELIFLGHKIKEGKVEPNPVKVEAILKAKRPTTKSQVRSFLGLAGYYRKFIPNFAGTATVLTDLTRKGQPNKVSWNSAHETAFQSLKEVLSKQPILCMPDLGKPFILRTDASNEGLGAVLLQEMDGSKLPVAYASRKLLPREVRYSVVEKECLGVVWGIQKFHSFLYGRQFTLETDHMPLVYLNKAKDSNGRLMRWALHLQIYRFTIVAIKGSENVGADYLSRSDWK